MNELNLERTLSRDDFIHALAASSVPATGLQICRTRAISFYRPPTKARDRGNPTLNPSFTITTPFNLLSSTPFTTPASMFFYIHPTLKSNAIFYILYLCIMHDRGLLLLYLSLPNADFSHLSFIYFPQLLLNYNVHSTFSFISPSMVRKGQESLANSIGLVI